MGFLSVPPTARSPEPSTSRTNTVIRSLVAFFAMAPADLADTGAASIKRGESAALRRHVGPPRRQNPSTRELGVAAEFAGVASFKGATPVMETHRSRSHWTSLQ